MEINALRNTVAALKDEAARLEDAIELAEAELARLCTPGRDTEPADADVPAVAAKIVGELRRFRVEHAGWGATLAGVGAALRLAEAKERLDNDERSRVDTPLGSAVPLGDLATSAVRRAYAMLLDPELDGVRGIERRRARFREQVVTFDTLVAAHHEREETLVGVVVIPDDVEVVDVGESRGGRHRQKVGRVPAVYRGRFAEAFIDLYSPTEP